MTSGRLSRTSGEGSAPSKPSVLVVLLKRHRSGTVGLALVGAFITTALLAGWLAPYHPYAQDLPRRSLPPNPLNLLGTDRLGRDILSRTIHGSRVSLTVGVLAVTVGAGLGVTIGLVSGYFGGWLDMALMRVVDILLAFPVYLMALAVIAILGSSLLNVVVAIGIASFPSYARLIRGDVLSVKTQDFVEAARAIGAGSIKIMTQHILPNILGSIIVVSTLRVGYAILVEAGLSFLGLGIPPPTPSWGAMVNEGLRFVWSAPWEATFPGLAIMLLVLGLNLLGDGLRDTLDPRLR